MMRVAAAVVDITPRHPAPLGGYWQREGVRLSSGVDEPLEANLLLLDGAEASVLIVAIDALYAGPDLERELAARCRQRGWPAQVCVLASHTHGAPMLDRGKPRLGPFDSAWHDAVVALLDAAIGQAFRTLQPGASLSTAQREIAGSIHRRTPIRRPVVQGRRIVTRGTLMGPHAVGARAPTCRAAVLRDAGGGIVCTLVSWACHPADNPARDRVSPDFVGALRRAIRSALGAHPVLFLQGFSGDVRGLIPAPRSARMLGRRLLRGPVFMPPTQAAWDRWAEAVGQAIAAVASEAARNPRSLLQHLRVGAASLPLSALLDGAERGSCRACSLRIGETVELFMVSAEVSAEYAPAVERLGAWPVGCLNDVYGYFPTDAQIPLGGYEVEGFRRNFGITGRFRRSNDASFAYLLNESRQRSSASNSSLMHSIQ